MQISSWIANLFIVTTSASSSTTASGSFWFASVLLHRQPPLHLRLGESLKGQRYEEFDDVGSITIFADYIVPAVLPQLGVLRYSSTLVNRLIKKLVQAVRRKFN